MKVKNNNRLLLILIILFLIIGAVLIFFNPIENLIIKFSKLKNFVTNEYQGNIISDDALSKYYTKNQKFIDVKHYSIKLDLFPKKKLLRGNTIISGDVTDSAITSLDFNLHDI